MFGEFEVVLLFRAMGVLGFAVFVGTYALLSLRYLTGDSVAFFAGNTVAAAFVLLSNIGEFNLAVFLIQVLFIAISLCAMILLFLEATGHSELE